MAIGPGAADSRLAIDVHGLAELKRQAREDPRAGLAVAAKQFEALFMQMVLKAMRDAVPQEGGLFGGGSETRTYQSLLDQQLAQSLSGRGPSALAAALERQLARGLPAADAPAPGALPAPGLLPLPAAVPERRQTLPVAPRALPAAEAALPADPSSPEAAVAPPPHARAFVDRLWPHAREASLATGIPAHFLIAHAALETGWGRGEIRTAAGQASHNLFNIKAGRGWQGATVEVLTTEYVDGQPRKQVERFRAYGSYGEAFADYARLLRLRYAEVMGARDAGAFARGLQDAGYATDPMYADKLTRIIGGATLRASLAG